MSKNRLFSTLVITVLVCILLSGCYNKEVLTAYNNAQNSDVSDDSAVSDNSDTSDINDDSLSDESQENDATEENSQEIIDDNNAPMDDDTELLDEEKSNTTHQPEELGLYVSEINYDYGEGVLFTVYDYYELFEDGTGRLSIQDAFDITWDDVYINGSTYDFSENILTIHEGDYDRVFDKHTKAIVKPIEYNITPGNIPDGYYYIEIDRRCNIQNIDGKNQLTTTVYTKDKYDAGKIDNLQIGDAIFTDGRNLSIIEYIEKEDGAIKINGRDPFEGEIITFVADKSSDYYLAVTDEEYGWLSYSQVDQLDDSYIPLSDTLVFEDYSNDPDKAKIGDINDFKALIENDTLYESRYKWMILVEGGEIVKIVRNYDKS